MNPYGEPNSARGRAQVPPSGAGRDHDWSDVKASPGVGSAQVGAAPSGGGAPRAGRAGVGRASVGRASVGRASVPAAGGHPYDDRSYGDRSYGDRSYEDRSNGARGAGRAAVPGVATGRASVPPVVAPGVPVSPGVPTGPDRGNGWGGPGRPTPRRARGSSARAKRNKRRNWIIGTLAVFIMIAGAGVVGGTWYYDEVPRPTDFGVPEATTVFFNDGKTQLAKLGEANRSIVPITAIPEHVRHAVVSAEDRKFYDHDGIDVQGIVRAAWNNVTGGETQGASTITQQYAREVASLTGITYARKIREAVIANKLEQDLSKDEILYHYLNTISFGRGTYGIEAAAQVYFRTSVSKLTVEQAAVLAAVIRQPYPAKGGHQGYDPANNEPAAKERWAYVLDGMVAKGWLDEGKRAAMKYPKVEPYQDGKVCAIDCGINQPTGNVINYVREELKAMGIENWKEGGYQVTTSINPGMQAILEKVIRRDVPGSELHGQPANLMAALVAVEPETGRVLAYYGGDNGTGTDYAGYNWEGGKRTGGHSPGSSFKVYTLAAGLKEGISMKTYWDATKVKDGNFPLSNAGRTPSCGKSCTLETSTLQSYNVPFYWLTKAIGPAKVLDAARAAGVRWMWNDGNEAFDLTAKKPEELAPQEFSTQIGYGQYGITVLDHANGVATLAARGVYRPAHFVLEVKKKDPASGQWKRVDGEQVKPQQVFDPNQVDDINAVLAKYPNKRMANGRESARKTGTWELNSKSPENGDAWNVGYTPQIAAAVWVGNKKERLPLKYKQYPTSRTLSKVWGNNLPTEIWKRFMDEAHKGLPRKSFPEAKNTGDENSPYADGVRPDQSPKCDIPLLCPGDGGGNRGGGPGRGGGGGGWFEPSPLPTVWQRE